MLEGSVAVVCVEFEHDKLDTAGGDAHPGPARAFVLAQVHLHDVVNHHQVCHITVFCPDTGNPLVIWTTMKES